MRRVGPGIHAIHDFREAHGHMRNAQGMSGGGGIALFDGFHRGLHETFEQFFNVLVEMAVFIRHARLRSQRKRQAHRAIRKRTHFAIDNFLAGQARLGMQLAIDELQNADHFPAPIFHGQRQHGSRPVSGFFVEARIELVGAIAGNSPGVGKVDHFAVQRGISRPENFPGGEARIQQREIARCRFASI